MRIFLQKEDEFYDLDTCYHVEHALRRHNLMCSSEDHINFHSTCKTDIGYRDNHWEGISPKDVYVGSLEFMREVFHSLGVKVVPIGIVKELIPFYDRDIKYSTLGHVRNNLPTNLFIKPYTDKQFPAYVIPESKDPDSVLQALFAETDHLPDTTVIIISPLEDFQAEHRCLVHNGELIDIRPYIGNWYDKGMQPDLDFIKKVISSWKNAPKAYALDVGVTVDGKTKIVEINDFWSCGCYGFEDAKLIYMLTQRYFEIVRKGTTAV